MENTERNFPLSYKLNGAISDRLNNREEETRMAEKNSKSITLNMDTKEAEKKLDALTEKASKLKSTLEEVKELIHSLSVN